MNSSFKERKCKLDQIAFILFLLFLFFLPLYEAPKNIFSALFVLLGTWIAVRDKFALELFRKKDLGIWAFLLVAISPFVSGVNSPYLEFSERFASALNWSLMPLVALVFMSLDISKIRLIWGLRILCAGTVVAVAQAWIMWEDGYPELNSVGHVNQSALYLAFSIVPAGILFFTRTTWADLVLILLTVFAVFWFQGPARSILGVSASLTLVGGLWTIYCLSRRYHKVLIGSLVFCAGFVGLAVAMPPQYFGPYQDLKQEFDSRLNSNTNPYARRDKLVNAALEVAGTSVTGFGLGSFGAATTTKKIKESVEARGGDWSAQKTQYFTSSHGHNVFGNVLVERGWLGIFALGTFILALVVSFSRNIQTDVSRVGVLTLVVICLAGLAQSTLHVEHGQLAFMCLAICLMMTRKIHGKDDV